jgi:hypothetical protein
MNESGELCIQNTRGYSRTTLCQLFATKFHKKGYHATSQSHSGSSKATLTLGLAAVIDGRGVNACIVCDTPAARMNSSLSSVLVLPRALGFFCGKFKKFLVQKS